MYIKCKTKKLTIGNQKIWKIREWVKRECNHKPMIIVKYDEQPNDTCKKGEQ